MPATQMNTRIDSELKSSGDLVLKRFGVSPSQAVRSLWEEMTETGTIPDFMQAVDKKNPSERQTKEWSLSGAGMAITLAQSERLFFKNTADKMAFEDKMNAMTFSELKEAAFEESLLEKE